MENERLFEYFNTGRMTCDGIACKNYQKNGNGGKSMNTQKIVLGVWS